MIAQFSGLPMTKLARGINPKMAKMIANMYYVGVIQHLIGIDQVALEKAVNQQFKGKKSAKNGGQSQSYRRRQKDGRRGHHMG